MAGDSKFDLESPVNGSEKWPKLLGVGQPEGRDISWRAGNAAMTEHEVPDTSHLFLGTEARNDRLMTFC